MFFKWSFKKYSLSTICKTNYNSKINNFIIDKKSKINLNKITNIFNFNNEAINNNDFSPWAPNDNLWLISVVSIKNKEAERLLKHWIDIIIGVFAILGIYDEFWYSKNQKMRKHRVWLMYHINEAINKY